MDDGVTKDRRPSDKFMSAHRQACDERKMEVADLLLQALELHLPGIGGRKSESCESTERLGPAFGRYERAFGG